MHTLKMREAFSMVTAVFVIIIMATVGMFITNTGGKIVKSTTTQYQHAQAELYAKSYTEYAVMSITAHNRTAANNCVEHINGTIGNPIGTGVGYQIDVFIAYIGNNAEINMCTANRQLGNSVTASTPLTAIIDAYVRYKDPDNPNGGWLSVHRRTIQKI